MTAIIAAAARDLNEIDFISRDVEQFEKTALDQAARPLV
jgi:hypothetical protein